MGKIILFILVILSLNHDCHAQRTSWYPIGPAPQNSRYSNKVSGRIWSIAVSPSYIEGGNIKPATMFIAPEGGGIWRSKDFESLSPIWEPLTDNLSQAQIIQTIVVAPKDPKTIYAGGNNRCLIKSIDGGSTWTQIPINKSDKGTTVTNILINPINNDMYLGLAYQGAIYRLTKTDTILINNGLPNGQTFSFDFTLDNEGIITLYAGTRWDMSPSINGIWFYTEKNGKWQSMLSNIDLFDITKQTRINGSTSGGICFVADHSLGSIHGIYAAVSNYIADDPNLLNIFKLLNDNWVPLISSNSNFNGLISKNTPISTYGAFTLGLSESGAIYIGMGNVPCHSVFQSTDQGKTWASIRSGTNGITPHSDERCFGFYSGKVYMGNDGGIYRFNPLANGKAGANTWESLNTSSLQTILVNGVGINPSNPNIVLCGSQDNAIALLNNGIWTETGGADNSKILFDPDPKNNGKYVFTTGVSDYSFFFRSDDGGTTWNDKSPDDARPGHQSAGIGLYSPFAIDPANSSRIVVGIDRVYETFNRGDNWGKQKSPVFDPTVTRNDGTIAGNPSTAIAYASNDIILVAYCNKIYRTINDGGDGTADNWSEISGGTDFGGSIIKILVDTRSSDTVYLGIDQGIIWKGTLNNQNYKWTKINGNLPKVYINTLCLVLTKPSGFPMLFAGTDKGVYMTNNDGIIWTPYNVNLPVGNVTDLQYTSYSCPTGMLVAGLYGRGIFKTYIPVNPNISSTGDPFSLMDEWGTFHTLYRDINNQISDIYYQDGKKCPWEYNNLTQILNNAPPLANDNPFSIMDKWGTFHVLYRDINNQISDIYYQDGKGKGWQYINHNIANAPFAKDGPVSFIDKWSTFHILYRDINNQISDIFYSGGKGWEYQNLFLNPNHRPPLTNSNPFSIMDKWETFHVLYRDVNNQISDIFYRNGKGWEYQNLFLNPNHLPPLANSNPFSIMDKWGTIHILYRDINNQISDIFYSDGKGWEYQNLFLNPNQLPPSANSTPFSIMDKWGTFHVFYRDINNQISDIFYQDGKGWQYNDLNRTTNNAFLSVTGNPYSIIDKWGTMHLIYRNSNNELSDIYYRDGIGWQYRLL